MASAERFTIAHRDEFERSGAKWGLARRSLGINSFGMNLVDLEPGESIPEHTEAERGHEEVFVVLSGTPTMVIDGQEHPVATGTYVRLDPEPRRTVVNTGSEPCSVLIVSAPTTSGYEPLEWA
jgi:quercetin dioxygenase-like cupin family protein